MIGADVLRGKKVVNIDREINDGIELHAAAPVGNDKLDRRGFFEMVEIIAQVAAGELLIFVGSEKAGELFAAGLFAHQQVEKERLRFFQADGEQATAAFHARRLEQKGLNADVFHRAYLRKKRSVQLGTPIIVIFPSLVNDTGDGEDARLEKLLVKCRKLWDNAIGGREICQTYKKGAIF